MSADIIELLRTALENLDWNYVTLSRVQYFDGKKPPEFASEAHWLERPFAYELYHQLRTLWETKKFECDCVIHAEVYKKYQAIKDLDKMPDFLFHLPEPNRNLAVVEIKLAANPGLQDDLDKLTLFQSILGYQHLVEIVIGTDAQLGEIDTVLQIWAGESEQVGTESTIEILYVSLSDKKVRHRRTTYTHSSCRLGRG
jgi:hypothetical protein